MQTDNITTESPEVTPDAPKEEVINPMDVLNKYAETLRLSSEERAKEKKAVHLAKAIAYMGEGKTKEAMAELSQADSPIMDTPKDTMMRLFTESLKEYAVLIDENEISLYDLWFWLYKNTVAKSDRKVNPDSATASARTIYDDGVYTAVFGGVTYDCVIAGNKLSTKWGDVSLSQAQKYLECRELKIEPAEWEANYLKKNNRNFTGHSTRGIFRKKD